MKFFKFSFLLRNPRDFDINLNKKTNKSNANSKPEEIAKDIVPK